MVVILAKCINQYGKRLIQTCLVWSDNSVIDNSRLRTITAFFKRSLRWSEMNCSPGIHSMLMIPIPLILGWNTFKLNLINFFKVRTTYWKFNKIELEKINTKVEVCLKAGDFTTILQISLLLYRFNNGSGSVFRAPFTRELFPCNPRSFWYLDLTSFNIKFQQVQIQGHAESEISREERYCRKHN